MTQGSFNHGHLPYLIIASREAEATLGRELRPAALAAMRAVLLARRSVEVAHQQVSWRGAALAFSCHVGARGDLVLRLDLGDPRLGDRLILESDLKRAQQRAHPRRRGGGA